MIGLLALLQEGTTGNPTPLGIAHFFIGFFLILSMYGGALVFTYWISRDE
jgi:hypothetical protein